jgi:formylglycine-generating enzyme required for sulfatase activity
MNRMMLYCILVVSLLTGCISSSQAAQVVHQSIDTGIDPNSWVQVPAGEFLMGLHEHETMVDYDYEIMVTDVTNAQFADYLNAALTDGTIEFDNNAIVGFYPGDKFRGYEHEEEIRAGKWLHVPLDDEGLRLDFDGSSFSPVPGYENHPMVIVTWFGAKAYCEYYGWRLPSEVEWEKAARGTDARPYPWGLEISQNNANYYSSHDLYEKIVGGLGDTTPVGFYNGRSYGDYHTIDSPSPYGAYDMAGNVWQWTGDVYPDQHYRYMRGGSKENYAYNLRVWTRNSAGPDYFSPNVGFRCLRQVAE